jgi:hypothetical protein
MTHAQIPELTSRESEKTLEEMLDIIGDWLSNLASSENAKDGEGEDNEETERGTLSKDDEPGCVMVTITKTVQQRIESYRQKLVKVDNLTQPG